MNDTNIEQDAQPPKNSAMQTTVIVAVAVACVSVRENFHKPFFVFGNFSFFYWQYQLFIQLSILMHRGDYEQYGLTFSFNFKKKPASVIKCSSTINNIIIPKSIIHRKQEFIITSIYHHSFKSCIFRMFQFIGDNNSTRF